MRFGDGHPDFRVSKTEWRKRDEMFEKGFHWCSKCKNFIALSNFSKAKSTRYGYYYWCKQCHSAARKGNLHTQSKARNRARQFMSYYKKLFGGECAKCGYNKSQSALEFHHVNPSEKESLISPLINSGKPHEIILLEVGKCILLCRNCHMEFESSVWQCKFEKVEIGYVIKEDSIIENIQNRWYEVNDKVLYNQASLI